MNGWRCVKCGQVWNTEVPPIECDCGCRIIHTFEGVSGTPSVAAGTGSYRWVVVAACCLGVLTLAIGGGVAFRQMRLARQARAEDAARVAGQRQVDDDAARALSALAETKRRADASDAERAERIQREAEATRLREETARAEAARRSEAEAAAARAEAELKAAELARNPPPGYRVEDGRLVWYPGMRHSRFSHVFASDNEKKWSKDEGYEWVDPDGPSLEVCWKAGMKLSETRRTGDREGTFEEWKRCERCGGDGEVGQNVQTHCARCGGTGRMDCLLKASNGGSCARSVCGFCGGNKGLWSFGMFTPCALCNGQGVRVCGMCQGSGKMPCSNCFGTGGKQTQRVDEKCPDCDGEGGKWKKAAPKYS